MMDTVRSLFKIMLRLLWHFFSPAALLAPTTKEGAEELASIDMKYHEMNTGQIPTLNDFEEYKRQYLE